jgi:hypothetical protein
MANKIFMIFDMFIGIIEFAMAWGLTFSLVRFLAFSIVFFKGFFTFVDVLNILLQFQHIPRASTLFICGVSC